MEILAQDSGGGGGAGGAFILIVYLVVAVAAIAGLWKMFEKAGEPGWAAIVPFYNAWVLVKISGKEVWWFFLMFVPCVNIVAIIIIDIAVAERFGKSAGYGIGMFFLPVVFYPMLGFGDAEYQGAPTTGM